MSLQEIAGAVNELALNWSEFKGRNEDRLNEVERRINQIHAGAISSGSWGGSSPRYGADDPRMAKLASDSEYSTAFQNYLKNSATGLSGSILNSLSVGSDPEGGYLCPPDMSGRIVTKIHEISPIRQIASVAVTRSGELQGVADTGEFAGEWVGEQTTRGETETPQVKVWNVPVHELASTPTATQRVVDDGSLLDVATWVENKVAQAFARMEAAAFVVGSGIAKPRGFLSYDVSTDDDDSREWGVLQVVNSGASGGFPLMSGAVLASDARALYTIVSKLKAPYRARARWVMNRETLAMVRTLRDENGRTLLVDGLREGESTLLLGFPITLAEDMPAPASDSYSIAFGDFSGYQIVDRYGIRVLRDVYTTKGKVKFYSTMRVGGGVVDFDALKILKLAA